MTSTSPPKQPEAVGRYNRLQALALIILTVFIYFSFLDAYPLLDPDEGRYAEIGREMLESGDFITPRLNYVPYFEKPPLYYWLTTASLYIFGENERAVRVVAGSVGLLTVLLVMGMGRRLFGYQTGTRAGWVYLTALLPFAMARLPVIDGLFSLLLSATWSAWWVAYKAREPDLARPWYLAAWTCLGLAVMTKGVAAVALTGLIIFSYLLLRRDLGALKRMQWLKGLIIFALIAVPWHVAAYLRTPQFAHFYFVVQHLGRVMGTEHVKPIWYFLATFPLTMMFWGLFLFPAFFSAVRRAWGALKLRRPVAGSELEASPKKDPQAESFLFLVLWAGAVIGLFSLSRCKLLTYIMPACPAAALVLAGYLQGDALKRTAAQWCAALTALILMGMIPLVSYYTGLQKIVPEAEIRTVALGFQAALLLGGLILAFTAFRPGFVPAAVGLAFLLTLPPLAVGIPKVVEYRKLGTLAKALPRPLPDKVRVAEWHTYDRSLGFYTRKRIILVDEASELAFGMSLQGNTGFFREGRSSIMRLAREGPLLLNLRPEDWSEVMSWSLFQVVAANARNVMVGNEDFFRLTGLSPWPQTAVTSPPLYLPPHTEAGVAPP